MEHSSDHVLIDKSRAGDMTAFRMLVLRHEGRVAGVVRAMMGATAEAEDVGQEVFIRFYDSLNKFRDDTNVRTYLLRLSITLSLNEIKRNKRTTYGFTRVEADTENKGTGTTDLKELLYGRPFIIETITQIDSLQIQTDRKVHAVVDSFEVKVQPILNEKQMESLKQFHRRGRKAKESI